MNFYVTLANVLECVGLTGAAAALIFLVWAFIGQRGDRRKRRLKISLSGAILFVATGLVFFTSFYLIFPLAEFSSHNYQPPYHWPGIILSAVGQGCIFILAGLVIWMLWRQRASRKWQPLLLLATTLLAAGTSAAAYALIFSVQIPAFQRYVMIENRDWKTHFGQQAPDIAIVMLDGSHKRLSDLRGKVVLLNFFATWCGPCMYELPHLQELWNDLKDQPDFSMFVIDRDETKDIVEPFLSKKGFTFPVAIDSGSVGFHEFAKEDIPRTYVIGRDGEILFQTVGFGEGVPVYQRELTTLRNTIERELARGQ